MELPENVQSDSSMGRANRLVGFSEHHLVGVKLDKFRQELVCQLIDLQQELKLLFTKKVKKEKKGKGEDDDRKD